MAVARTAGPQAGFGAGTEWVVGKGRWAALDTRPDLRFWVL